MIKQYVFTSDYQTQAVYVPHFQTAPMAMFKKGDIYQLFSEIAPGIPTLTGTLMFRYNLPNNVGVASYSIPTNVVKEYNRKNRKNISLKSTPTESSYFGGMQSEESQENLKSAFAVIGVAAYILIFYFLFTGYPKD
jgi:hypothetical protein